jgi:Ser/Thr protein kinase RdoA (MazF antagonist)
MTGSTSDLARAALTAWDAGATAPRLISERENAVFEIALADGHRAVLRLHRHGYNSLAEIRSELWWMKELAHAGFATPAPIATRDGALVHVLDTGRAATVLSWADGAPVGDGNAPLPGTAAEQRARYREIGAMLARLHALSDTFAPPDWFTRRAWDIDGFLGPDPEWGRFWENPALTEEGRAIVQTARAAARADLEAHAATGADFGLIHADALRENVFAGAKGLTLIDFDDAGFGFRLYDLTTAVSQSIDDPDHGALLDAVVEGYAARRTLSDQERRLLPLFAMLRTFASCGWVLPRLPADHPRIPKSARRAVAAARTYLALRA